MAKQDHIILGVHITDRLQHVTDVQKLLSEYGCSIKTRLGLHEASATVCSPNGLLLLEMVGDTATCLQLMEKLNKIGGIECQKMVFNHD